MEQLRMVFEGNNTEAFTLPSGYSFEYYGGKEEQRADWIKICAQGRLGVDGTADEFNRDIVKTPGVTPERDLIFVVSPTGERVATITFFEQPDKETAWLHMVCCAESARGLGIGNAIVSFATSRLLERGVKKIMLKTDDWRIPAIKAYMRFGFRPVTEGFDYAERWKTILASIASDNH